MANLAVTKTWGSEKLKSSDLNQNFTDVVNYINNRNGGGTAWDALNVTGTSTLTGAVSCGSSLTVSGNILTVGGPSALTGYRRPNLTFIGVTTVDVENNTGTSNQTSIMFPDGAILSVTEDTSSTNKYRRFDITATANFSSGTEDSGLRSGLAEAANTWYAIYAVKSSINTANFVLAGDTTLPLQANFSTLNGRYGTNGWVYLGMIRNGDNKGATSDILSFYQSGSLTYFNNTLAAAVGLMGTLLATTAGAATLTYTYSAGTGTTAIPNHIKLVRFGSYFVPGAGVTIQNSTTGRFKYMDNTATQSGVFHYVDIANEGLLVSTTLSSTAKDICLSAFVDPLLSGELSHTL